MENPSRATERHLSYGITNPNNWRCSLTAVIFFCSYKLSNVVHAITVAGWRWRLRG